MNSYNTKKSYLIGAVSLRLRENLENNRHKKRVVSYLTLVSGSPIIQNGKLVGAVTHVFLDDPTSGYAIFAENMLQTATTAVKQNLKDAS